MTNYQRHSFHNSVNDLSNFWLVTSKTRGLRNVPEFVKGIAMWNGKSSTIQHHESWMLDSLGVIYFVLELDYSQSQPGLKSQIILLWITNTGTVDWQHSTQPPTIAQHSKLGSGSNTQNEAYVN